MIIGGSTISECLTLRDSIELEPSKLKFQCKRIEAQKIQIPLLWKMCLLI